MPTTEAIKRGCSPIFNQKKTGVRALFIIFERAQGELKL
jgi:hypothetical protein